MILTPIKTIMALALPGFVSFIPPWENVNGQSLSGQGEFRVYCSIGTERNQLVGTLPAQWPYEKSYREVVDLNPLLLPGGYDCYFTAVLNDVESAPSDTVTVIIPE